MILKSDVISMLNNLVAFHSVIRSKRKMFPSSEETSVFIAFLHFRRRFWHLPLLLGQLNLPQFSAYVERAPIPKAIYFDCDRCQELI